MDVLSAIAEGERFHNGLFNGFGFFLKLKGVRQHHGSRCDGRDGIGDVSSRNVRGASVNRFEQTDLGPDAGRGQHADRTSEHRRFIAENVSEHVVAQEDIELSWISDQLHGGVIDIDMPQFNVRIGRMDLNDDLAPQLGGFQYISLVHRGYFFSPFPRRLERHLGNPTNFFRGIGFCIDPPLLTIR